MKNSPPRKIKGSTPDGKRAIFRRVSPIMTFASIAVVIAASLLLYSVIIWRDDFAFSFAIAGIALLLTWYIQVLNMYKEQRFRATSICAKIEAVKINNNRLILTIKNVGSSNITQAVFGDLLINDKVPITQSTIINFISVGDTEDLEIILPFRISYVKKLSYKISSGYSNAYVMLVFEQEMRTKSKIVTFKDNTCTLTTWVYHKWPI